MIQFTIKNELSPALRQYSAELEHTVTLTVKELRDIVTFVATNEFMREPRPDEVVDPASRTLNAPLVRRFKFNNDTSVLRRLTGRLTQSLLGNRGGLQPFFIAIAGNETIEVIEASSQQVTLTFGSKTPYAYRHEYGVGVPKRPYLAPAIERVKSSGIVGRLFDQRLNELARRLDL